MGDGERGVRYRARKRAREKIIKINLRDRERKGENEQTKRVTRNNIGRTQRR